MYTFCSTNREVFFLEPEFYGKAAQIPVEIRSLSRFSRSIKSRLCLLHRNLLLSGIQEGNMVINFLYL
jgi:hypothetical protein